MFKGQPSQHAICVVRKQGTNRREAALSNLSPHPMENPDHPFSLENLVNTHQYCDGTQLYREDWELMKAAPALAVATKTCTTLAHKNVPRVDRKLGLP
jgi:hypothetical protein